MSFVLKPIESIDLPLVIKVPDGPGKTKECDLLVSWEYIDEESRRKFIDESSEEVERFKKQFEEFSEGKRKKKPKPLMTDAEHCKLRIKSIKGLLDEDGTEIEYKPEHMDLIYNWDYAAKAFSQQLNNVLSGTAIKEIIEKN